jgi:hypothetical protein
MEIVQAVRFPDGRLLILAAGVGRFKVLNALQTVPASRADVMLLPDAEELQAAAENSTKALEQLAKDDGKLSVMKAMHAADAAAQHAAAASAQAWWEYELMHCRVVPEKLAVIDSSDNETAAMQFGRRLVNIGSNEIMELPWAADEFNKKYFSSMQTPAPTSYEMLMSDEDEESETPLLDMNIKAVAAASDAAEAMVAKLLKQQQEEENGIENGLWRDLETFLRNRYSAINSLKERGINPIASSGAGGRLAPKIEDSSESDEEEEERERQSKSKRKDSAGKDAHALIECLKLEQQVWKEIDAVRDLAEKIAGRATPLADGLTCLRPCSSTTTTMQQSNGDVESVESFKPQEAEWKVKNSGEGAHPAYPNLRRVQRLSFALASSLGDVSASEGRQAWLEVHSIAGRLRLGLSALRRHRDVLAAVVAVRNLTDNGGGGGGGDGENLEN